MADRINVSELDFDTIKNNLKEFLKQQNQFTDYDFEGSGLNILLDILAYNTHYNAYYLNMVANEAFLDTALLRNSVVSHAKSLGYIPYSRKSSSATINLEVFSATSNTGTLTIPRGFSFLSNQIDGTTYNFVVLEDTTVTKANSSYYFENLSINEGNLISYRFVYDRSTNAKQIFQLPEENIDTSTLKVSVAPSQTSTSIDTYQKSTDVLNSESTDLIYFLQEDLNGKYQIYFGDDIIGKSLPDGAVVVVNYLVTNGPIANKANDFTATRPLVDTNAESLTNFDLDVVSNSEGGAERETVDRIKFAAPLQYASQNRIVSYRDYELFVRNSYPNLDSVSVWGGEDETPPVYGKVFISLKPADGYFLSEAEKDRIINEIIVPRSVVTVKPEYRDPDYLYLLASILVEYDAKRTTLTEESLKNAVKNATINYKDQYLDQFNSRFAVSKLQESIDGIDLNSIVGTDTTIRVQKRFEPVVGSIRNYTLNYNVPLLQGTTFNKLESTEFFVFDISGVERKVAIEEVPKSFTGINSIEITNPGSGYTSTPTVTITGDGFGATARAVISLGKIQSIVIDNPGIDYNKAIVTITGGGGSGATATAVIDTKIAKLRTVYYTLDAERVVVNNDVGTIDYENGIITLNDLLISNIDTPDGLVRINSGTQYNIIQSVKNTILTIDEEDASSILVTLQKV